MANDELNAQIIDGISIVLNPNESAPPVSEEVDIEETVKEINERIDKIEKRNKKLSESSLLKAENHRLRMINQMLQDDNYRMKRAAQGQELKLQQSQLELEFATECGTEDKFDWNTLKFIPKDK